MAKMNWSRAHLQNRVARFGSTPAIDKRDGKSDPVAVGTEVKWKRSRFAKGGGKGRSYRVIGHDGVPCPRSGQPTEIREHTEITERHLRQPFYFSRWFYCRNPACVVTLHMVEEFKVWNRRGGGGPKKKCRPPRYRPHSPDDDYEQVMAACHAYDGPCPWEE